MPNYTKVKNKIFNKTPKTLKRFFKFIAKIVNLYLTNDLPIFAGAASFFLTISCVPLFMILFSTISLIPAIKVDALIENINLLFPNIPYINQVFESLIRISMQLASKNVMSFNIIATLISGSTCLLSFIVGIRKVHYIKHTNNIILIRIMTILNIFILFFTIIFTMIFFVLGKFLIRLAENFFPLAVDLLSFILDYKYLAISIALTFLTLSLYTCCTNFKRHVIKNLFGSVFTTLSWFIVSNLFSIYFTYYPMSNNIYGSLTGVILALLWLFICMNIVFIGACVNEALYPSKKE